MEYAKRLPSDFSEDDETLEKDLMRFIADRNINNGIDMMFTDYELKDLADSNKRRKLIQQLKKDGRLSVGVQNSSFQDRKTLEIVRTFTTKSKCFNLPGENPKICAEMHQKLCLSATCNSILGVFTVLISMLLYDIEYDNDDTIRDRLWFRLSLLNTVTSIMLLISIIWYKQCELDWDISKHEFSDIENLFTSGRYKPLLCELFLNLFHPVWFLKDNKVIYYNDVLDRSVSYPINSLLCVAVLSRIYHTIRLVLIQSRYGSERARRVCKLNGVAAGRIWTLKCILLMHPFKSVVWMLLTGIFILGFSLRIFERPLTEPGAAGGFYNLGNAMWCIIITMTTVGFGDSFPVSACGRIIGILASIWGVFVVGLMIIGTTNMMKFNSGQSKSFILHQRLKFKDYFRKLAGAVLHSAFLFKIMMKKGKSSHAEVSQQRSTYKRNIIDFHNARLQSNILYNTNTPERKIEQKINEALEMANLNLENAKLTYFKLNEIVQRFNFN